MSSDKGLHLSLSGFPNCYDELTEKSQFRSNDSNNIQTFYDIDDPSIHSLIWKIHDKQMDTLFTTFTKFSPPLPHWLRV